jgi:hypothetical protein
MCRAARPCKLFSPDVIYGRHNHSWKCRIV